MKRYLIDAPILTAYLHQRPAAVDLLSPWVRHEEAATSILAYGEVVEYLQGRRDYPQHLGELRLLVKEIIPYFLSYAILERYATIRRQLRPLPRGAGLIGDVDTLIAATALVRNLTWSPLTGTSSASRTSK